MRTLFLQGANLILTIKILSRNIFHAVHTMYIKNTTTRDLLLLIKQLLNINPDVS